jgi:hypothetical protein
MKFAIKILLIFAVFNAFVPIIEMYEFAVDDLFVHNCCSDTSSSEESENPCNPICHCFNTLTLSATALYSFSLEVKSLHYHSITNKFIEEQTEPVFRPPIV